MHVRHQAPADGALVVAERGQTFPQHVAGLCRGVTRVDQHRAGVLLDEVHVHGLQPLVGQREGQAVHARGDRVHTGRIPPQVVRPVVDRPDLPGSAHQMSSHSTASCAVVSPTATRSPATVPALAARTGFSIFMASTTAMTSPASTSCPSWTATFTTVPCMGAVTAPLA